MSLHRCFTAPLLIFLLAAGAQAADESYAIKLHRPFSVGEQFDTHIVVERSRTVTIDTGGPAPRVQNDSTTGDLTARVEVTDVDKTGEIVGMVATVKKLTDGTGKELLEAGKEVVIKRTEDAVTFTLAAGDLSPDAKSMLGNMFSKHKPNGPTDDDIFGSKTPRKPGDQWDMDSAKAASNLSESGTTVDATDLTGKATFKSVETVNGIPMLRANGDMDARNVKPPAPGPGVMVSSCTMQVHFTGLYPTSEALPVYDCQTQIDMQMHALVTGTPTNYDVKAHMQHTETITLVKK